MYAWTSSGSSSQRTSLSSVFDRMWSSLMYRIPSARLMIFVDLALLQVIQAFTPWLNATSSGWSCLPSRYAAGMGQPVRSATVPSNPRDVKRALVRFCPSHHLFMPAQHTARNRPAPPNQWGATPNHSHPV